MSLSYTLANLKTTLQDWLEDDDADFVAALDDIIGKGELMLWRDVDIQNFDSYATAAITNAVATVTKPANLLVERFVSVTVAGDETIVEPATAAWVSDYNRGANTGTSRYYSETSITSWTLAPTPSANATLNVYGTYGPQSLVDVPTGTWLSQRAPDILFLACKIKAAEYTKKWTQMKEAQGEYKAELDNFIGLVRSLKRTDIEDIVQQRRTDQQPVTNQPVEAT